MIQKQSLPINFSQGLDLKNDPFQVQVGKFLSLENSIFDTGWLLQKRNGFGAMTALPDATNTYLTTFNSNLTAIGTTLNAFGAPTNAWFNKGNLLPTSLTTLPLIRSNTNQIQSDSVLHPNGYIMTVYTDNVPLSGTVTAEYKYVIADSVTGQNIIEPTIIAGNGTVTFSPRAFVLGNYFIILFTDVVAGIDQLTYIAISAITPSLPIIRPGSPISIVYTAESTVNFDAYVANDTLYIAWNGSDNSIRVSYLSRNLMQGGTQAFSGFQSDYMSVTADITQSNLTVWVSWAQTSNQELHTLAVTSNLATVLAPTLVQTAGAPPANITTTAQNGTLTYIVEIATNLPYDSSIPYHGTYYLNVTQPGVITGPFLNFTSIGIASKAIIVNDMTYFLASYQSPLQKTYFLLNLMGNVVAKLAYENGHGYVTLGLPSMTLFSSNIISCSYLIADRVEAQAKATNQPNQPAVYAQFGINQVTFVIGAKNISTAEIGGNLNISGGFLTNYDGYSIVENGFFLFPEFVEATPNTTGGSMAANQYYYQVTYEWADNQGNLYRSAPSVPLNVITTGTTSSVTLNIPTLQLTYKTQNPVKIVIYRWSLTQQVYYQVTSITNPLLNIVSISNSFVTFTDTQSDAQILGNNIIYTTGGVLEHIAPPATDLIALFDTRLFIVDSEDRNLLWYSNQVIENTPVEMSDLLTFYVAPTESAQGPTGPITALAALDDKLILFKKNAIYYINGTGPNITGANSQYSEATFVNSTIGCTNQASIVFTPSGLMFQSDKGIWLLDRNLGTTYIGAPVQTLTTGALVKSALNIPATNQVRFTMDSGITLMYDYYYGQWGTFTGIPGIAGTLYNSLHTYINDLGDVFQETPGLYLDNTNPVLMSLSTSWITLAGIQGLERFFEMYLLGVYYTPFTLNVQLAINYNSSNSQSTIVAPDSYVPSWGGDTLWGGSSPWGGNGKVFKARVFPHEQKVESFQISISELYDPSKGIAAGAGLTLSGMNLIVGMLKGSRNSPGARNFG